MNKIHKVKLKLKFRKTTNNIKKRSLLITQIYLIRGGELIPIKKINDYHT